MIGNSPNWDLVIINAHTKLGQILSISSLRYWTETKFWIKFCYQYRAITLLKFCEKWCVKIPIYILSISMHIQNLVKFYRVVLEILSGNKNYDWQF